jgi:glycosyltransferase involved in cell wall biosynthesis
VDLIIAHTPPFFSVARWTGGHPAVIAYDYGEPPPEWFPDTAERQVILTEKDQSLIMATAVYAISNAITSESRTPVDGVIPLGNAHLGRWTEDLVARRDAVRARRDWQGKFVVLNVCRFHIGERRYKGVDLYAKVSAATKQKSAAGSQQAVFVLCGKGTPADVEAMTALGLTVAANVTDEEMTDLYCAADAYANFSQWEGYNLGIGQALAMGLPTIASDIPAHRAFGIDVTNDVEFAADWVLQNAAVQSPRVPKVWSWEAPCKRLVEVIESMVGGLAVDRVPTAPRNSA